MSIKDQLRKRRPRKVTLDGDDFYVVSMTIAEADHVDILSKDDSRNGEILGYCLSRCLVDEAGQPILEGEADPVIKEIPIETATKLAQEIRNATNPPPVDSAKKD